MRRTGTALGRMVTAAGRCHLWPGPDWSRPGHLFPTHSDFDARAKLEDFRHIIFFYQTDAVFRGMAVLGGDRRPARRLELSAQLHPLQNDAAVHRHLYGHGYGHGCGHWYGHGCKHMYGHVSKPSAATHNCRRVGGLETTCSDAAASHAHRHVRRHGDRHGYASIHASIPASTWASTWVWIHA